MKPARNGSRVCGSEGGARVGEGGARTEGWLLGRAGSAAFSFSIARSVMASTSARVTDMRRHEEDTTLRLMPNLAGCTADRCIERWQANWAGKLPTCRRNFVPVKLPKVEHASGTSKYSELMN